MSLIPPPHSSNNVSFHKHRSLDNKFSIDSSSYYFIRPIQMGCFTSSTPLRHKEALTNRTLTIGTLNYCGILSSPFEFYSQENHQEQAKISNIFRKLFPQYIPTFNQDNFQWKMGKVGKDIQKGRFSLMFDPAAGSDGVRFMTKEEFQKRWDEDFAKLIEGMKAEERKWTEQEVETSRLFDLVFYHALLLYVFGQGTTDGSFEQAIKNDPVVFRSKIDYFYRQNFLDQQQKLANFRKGYLKLRPDVFFVQEYSQKLLAAIKTEKLRHVIDAKEDSLIIINELSFKEFKPFNYIIDQIEDSTHREQLLKWGSKLAISVADDYVFICVHLSSKSAVNPVQIQQLRANLVLLNKCLPKYRIVLGGDLNSYLTPDETLSTQFKFFPESEQQFTTIKKRTFTQAQFHKAEVEVKQSKDRIITTEPIEHGEVAYMGGQGKVDPHAYLPSNAHPYDHLLCVATIRRR